MISMDVFEFKSISDELRKTCHSVIGILSIKYTFRIHCYIFTILCHAAIIDYIKNL